jgi:site-specific DNA-methyltransferase (adenine-specific)
MEVFNIGNSKLYNGDCFLALPSIKDGSIDAIICDLPYGTTKCKWDSKLDIEDLWKHYKRILKPKGVVVLFAQTPFDKVLGCSNLEWLKYEWIWEKTAATGHLNAKKMPMKAHENILIFYNLPPTYNPQKTQGHERKVSKADHKRNCLESEVYSKGQKATNYDSTERYPRSVQVFSSDKQSNRLNGTLHPTQKPLALLEMLVKTYTNEGDLVLDNTMGSGTTILACENLNRNSIGIELDKKFFDITIKRLRISEAERKSL